MREARQLTKRDHVLDALPLAALREALALGGCQPFLVPATGIQSAPPAVVARDHRRRRPPRARSTATVFTRRRGRNRFAGYGLGLRLDDRSRRLRRRGCLGLGGWRRGDRLSRRDRRRVLDHHLRFLARTVGGRAARAETLPGH